MALSSGEEAQAMTVCMGDENTTRTTVLVISGVKFGWPLKQSQHGYFNCRREGVLPFMSLLDAWLTQCSNFQDGDRVLVLPHPFFNSAASFPLLHQVIIRQTLKDDTSSNTRESKASTSIHMT